MTREKALGTIMDFPEKFDVEELIEKLIFIQQVEEGLEQSKNRQVVTMEEAKNRMSKWL